MKPFRKVSKKITVNDFIFHCIINEIPSNDSVCFKVYSSKTSFFEIHFTWQGSWHINLHKPKTCESLIKYAIENGWDFRQDKKSMKIEQGDFLIEKLGFRDETISKTDSEEIKKILNNRLLYSDNPSCGFVKDILLQFIDGKIIFSFACDGDPNFNVSEEERNQIDKILKKYGATFPAVKKY